ncbi:MAG: asparagine synthase (glutamine-hydrolyzing) [Planctomycetota bacterium]
MCGILGVVHRDPRQPVDPTRLAAARDTLAHRGPDEAGLWCPRDGGVGLAHRRLKVQDLTHGQQPMADPGTSGGNALVYNGELYNHPQLRRELEADGHAFAGSGDTETLFRLLNRDGPAALPRLDGMFALGHWDTQNRRLLLARDRLGQKPLYWHDDGSQLVFASELKAVLAYLDRKFDVDAAALDEFFTRGYVLSPRTIFCGIHKLPAAASLRLDADDWRIDVAPYWDLAPLEAVACDDPEAAVDRLDELLTEAVRKRLVTDVPLGCLLSGGIDSSLITAIAAKTSEGPVKAFSIGFDESDAHNELPFAQMVAEHVGCDWRTETVRGGDFVNDLDDALPYFDEPFGNFTVIAQRKLARACRRELTVVLSGTGGDELAAGYPGRYGWTLDLPDDAPRHRQTPPLDRLRQHLAKTSFVGWGNGRAAMLNESLQHAITDAHHPASAVRPFWSATDDPLNDVLRADVRTNLPDYLVAIEERMTMSVGLEARNPLLDPAVVNHLLSLPPSLKVRDGQFKWPLWKLCERYLPRAAYDRPKRGFTPPLNLWLSQHAGRIAARFEALRDTLGGVFSPAWQAYLAAGRYEPAAAMPVYYSLALGVWAEHYGRYINAWPSAETSIPTPFHATLRDDDPAALGAARWFAQALGNFADGGTLRLVGDDSGFYRWLAGQLGYAVADDGTADGCVVVGLDAMDRLTWDGLADVVLVLPFGVTEQMGLQHRLRSLPGHVEVRATQVVPVGEGRGVLVARLKVGEPTRMGNVA